MAHKFYCHLFPVGKLFLIRAAYWKIFSFLTNSFLVFNATLGITTLLTTNISSLEKLKSRGWWGFVNHHECPTLCRVVIQLLSDTWARSLLPLTKVQYTCNFLTSGVAMTAGPWLLRPWLLRPWLLQPLCMLFWWPWTETVCRQLPCYVHVTRTVLIVIIS